MEQEVEHYEMLSEQREADLSKEVNNHLKLGWHLWGSPSTMSCGSVRYFSQAMVKYKKEKKQAHVM